VKDLADDLRRFLRGESVKAKPDNPVQRMGRWLGRHRMVALTSIFALVAIGVAAVAWENRVHSREQAAPMRPRRTRPAARSPSACIG